MKDPITATTMYLATYQFNYSGTVTDYTERVGRAHVRTMKEAAHMAIALSAANEGAVTLQGLDSEGRATTAAVWVEADEHSDEPDYAARIVIALKAAHYVETFRQILPTPSTSIYTYWSC